MWQTHKSWQKKLAWCTWHDVVVVTILVCTKSYFMGAIDYLLIYTIFLRSICVELAADLSLYSTHIFFIETSCSIILHMATHRHKSAIEGILLFTFQRMKNPVCLVSLNSQPKAMVSNQKYQFSSCSQLEGPKRLHSDSSQGWIAFGSSSVLFYVVLINDNRL